MIDFALKVRPKTALGKILRVPLKLIPKNHVMSIKTGSLRGTKWIVGSGLHGCWLGTYELTKQKLFASLVQPGMTVFDIGANAGFYTLLSALLTEKSGRVYAFEPSPLIVPFLRRHLELNNVRNVSVFDCAISNFSGEALFDEQRGSSEGKLSATGHTTTRVHTLDELLMKGEILPAQIVKIDVEGEELAVLQGGEEYFAQHKPTVLVATHSERMHSECTAILSSWGYSVSALKMDESGGSDELVGSPKRKS